MSVECRCRTIRTLAVLAAMIASPARATMITAMSLDQVTAGAAKVVQATVMDVRSGRDESHLPATWITLDVARTLKGRGGDRITIKQFGVAERLADGTVTRIAGLPHYTPGEQVVLFLQSESDRGFTSPVGFGQGCYRIIPNAGALMVRSDVAGGAALPLDEFVAKVERFVAAPR